MSEINLSFYMAMITKNMIILIFINDIPRFFITFHLNLALYSEAKCIVDVILSVKRSKYMLVTQGY